MAGRLKRVILQVVAGALYYSGLLHLRLLYRRAILGKKEVCVLGLHRVLSEVEETNANSLGAIVLREATFARMLEFLSREFHVVSLQAFLGGSESDQGQNVPRCLLTFDDGWRDNYTTAYPLLKKFDIPAVIFLVTGLVDGDETFWVEELKHACKSPAVLERVQRWHRGVKEERQQGADFYEVVEHLKHLPAHERQKALAELLPGGKDARQTNVGDRMLTWKEVSAMQSDGIEFEAHTVTHPLLVYEDDASVQRELRASKQAIETRLGKPVRAFAYPNGTYDERVRSMVKNSGYECAFTTERGWHSPGQDAYSIRRILIHEAQVAGIGGKFSPALFSLKLCGWH